MSDAMSDAAVDYELATTTNVIEYIM